MGVIALVFFGVSKSLFGVLRTGRGLGSIGKIAGAHKCLGWYDIPAQLAVSSATSDGPLNSLCCDQLIVGGRAKGLGRVLLLGDFLFSEGLVPNTVGGRFKIGDIFGVCFATFAEAGSWFVAFIFTSEEMRCLSIDGRL